MVGRFVGKSNGHVHSTREGRRVTGGQRAGLRRCYPLVSTLIQLCTSILSRRALATDKRPMMDSLRLSRPIISLCPKASEGFLKVDLHLLSLFFSFHLSFLFLTVFSLQTLLSRQARVESRKYSSFSTVSKTSPASRRPVVASCASLLHSFIASLFHCFVASFPRLTC